MSYQEIIMAEAQAKRNRKAIKSLRDVSSRAKGILVAELKLKRRQRIADNLRGVK